MRKMGKMMVTPLFLEKVCTRDYCMNYLDVCSDCQSGFYFDIDEFTFEP